MANWSKSFDLLLTPVTLEPAPSNEALAFNPAEPVGQALRTAAHCAFLQPFNLTGQPAMALPARAEGAITPVGVQLVALPGCEDQLLATGLQLEVAGALQIGRPSLGGLGA
jgi:Asp-tRNA(Asn)/Glu-tRNA(Gln) amidotransferase A subunit family amidase